MHPKASNIDKIGTYPALSFSGGGYFFDEVLEYRVWVHPDNGDDVYFHFFGDYESALAYSSHTKGAEEPCVLILQKEYIDEPEEGVFYKVKKERITEWQVDWLTDSKREADSLDKFIAENSNK